MYDVRENTMGKNNNASKVRGRRLHYANTSHPPPITPTATAEVRPIQLCARPSRCAEPVSGATVFVPTMLSHWV